MTTRTHTNFVAGLLDSSLTSGATTMTSSASTGASGLPGLIAISGSNTATIVLDPDRVAGAPEIIVVSAHTGAANTATISRGQEGTTARAHNAGIKWVHAVTQADVENFGVVPTTDSVSAAAEGTNTSYARSDHVHLLPTAAPTASFTPGQANTIGVSASVARADHLHAFALASAVTLNGGSANGQGSAATFTRSDHTHAISNGVSTPGNSGTGLAAVGAATDLARGDHSHSLDPAIPRGELSYNTNASDITGVAGVEKTVVSVTSTPATNRIIEVMASWRNIFATDTTSAYGMRLYAGATLLDEKVIEASQTGNGEMGGVIFGRFVGANTSTIFALKAIRLTGSGSCTVTNSGTGAPAQIWCKDVGGS